jgi:hypothetical protein
MMGETRQLVAAEVSERVRLDGVPSSVSVKRDPLVEDHLMRQA